MIPPLGMNPDFSAVGRGHRLEVSDAAEGFRWKEFHDREALCECRLELSACRDSREHRHVVVKTIIHHRWTEPGSHDELGAGMARFGCLHSRQYGPRTSQNIGTFVANSSERLGGPRGAKSDFSAGQAACLEGAGERDRILGIVDADDGNESKAAKSRKRRLERFSFRDCGFQGCDLTVLVRSGR